MYIILSFHSLKIEIPSFVIDVLAEDTAGEYYPVVINGFDDPIDFKDQYESIIKIMRQNEFKVLHKKRNEAMFSEEK